MEDIATAMNLTSNKFGDTLDTIFVSILEDLKVIHASNIVHRDGKWFMHVINVVSLDVIAS